MIFQKQIKSLFLSIKNEITKGNDGNEKTKIVQQDKNGNITENKYAEQTFPNKNNDSDLLTGKSKILQQTNKGTQSGGDKFSVSAFFHQHK